MKADDNIKKLVKESHISTGAGAEDRILADGLAELSQLKQKRSAHEPSVWRIIMKRRKTKIAFVAAIVVMITIGLSQLRVFSGNTSIAFGEVATQLRMAQTVTYKTTIERDGQKPLIESCMRLEPSRVRVEASDGSITIADIYLGESLILKPSERKAYKMSTVLPPRQISDWYEHFKEKLLEDFAQSSAQNIGEGVVEGRKVTGFSLKYKSLEITLWADIHSAAPVLIESVGSLDSDFVTDRHGRPTKVTISDMVLGEELDDALFSLTPPAGYTIEEAKAPISPTHAELMRRMSVQDMQGLHALCWKYAKTHDGRWPESLQAAIAWGREYHGADLAQFEPLLSLENAEQELGLVYVMPGPNYLSMTAGVYQKRVLVLYQVFDEWPATGIWVAYLDGSVALEQDESRFRRILEFSEARQYSNK